MTTLGWSRETWTVVKSIGNIYILISWMIRFGRECASPIPCHRYIISSFMFFITASSIDCWSMVWCWSIKIQSVWFRHTKSIDYWLQSEHSRGISSPVVKIPLLCDAARVFSFPSTTMNWKKRGTWKGWPIFQLAFSWKVTKWIMTVISALTHLSMTKVCNIEFFISTTMQCFKILSCCFANCQDFRPIKHVISFL